MKFPPILELVNSTLMLISTRFLFFNLSLSLKSLALYCFILNYHLLSTLNTNLTNGDNNNFFPPLYFPS